MSAVPISVVLCTRDRSEGIARAVRSILAGRLADFELIVVDQSRTAATAEALEPFRQDRRLALHRVGTTGLAVARNQGVRLAGAERIAFTDDDCEVGRTWLGDLLAAFDVDPRIGLVFGNVLPATFDPAQGILPSFVSAAPLLVRRVGQYLVDGMGASMALRRATWEKLGGFDERLGAGAPFRAGEETDFALRGLLAGSFLSFSADAGVVHHGFRDREAAGSLTQGYAYGLAAVLVKLLRCGHGSVAGVLARLAARWAFSRPRNELGSTPPRLGRLRGFLSGGLAALRTPVDRASNRFQPAGASLQRAVVAPTADR